MGVKPTSCFIFFVLLLGSFLDTSLSQADETISASQSLSGDQTILSSGGNFELGFFTRGNSNRYYIGIWYRKITEKTIVWVANRDTPILDKYSAELKILNGNLVLMSDSETSIWSTNVNSRTSNSVEAVLGDDGNLVLRDRSKSRLSSDPLWQSFENPTDTWLPGAKLSYNKIKKTKQILTSWKNVEDPAPGLFSAEVDPDWKGYMLRWNGSEEYWTSGSWNGHIFSLVPEMRLNYIYNFSYVDNENESYFTYSLYNPSIISRFIMDVTGQVKQLSSQKEWGLFWSQPQQQCEVYAYCGAFGVCSENSSSVCSCLPGFKHKSEKEWNLGDYSGGCVREVNLQCGNNSTSRGEKNWFLASQHMRLPKHSQPVTVGSAAECASMCLNNCACTAYAYHDKGCSVWNSEILNPQQLARDDASGRTIYIRHSSSTSEKNNRKPRRSLMIIIAVSSASVVILLCCFSYSFCRRRITKRKENFLSIWHKGHAKELAGEDDKRVADVPFFSLESILAATDNFSVANKLGQGGFGPVYKGEFPGRQEIAVKRLSSHSGQGTQEFQNEVELIAKLQHRNLVRLLGYCIKGNEKILLYEFMPNGSLDAIIFDHEARKILSWKKHYQIILGIARGLLYLHQDSRLRIIHRDLKTSNILLDAEMNPKISDFGLARIIGGKGTEACTKRIVGTYGYMSPEYALEGLFSIKSDVFSFGVVLLEIISGKRNTGFYQPQEPLNLLGYAWRLWNENKTMDLTDPTLLESCDSCELMKCINIGLLCVQEDPSHRPTMSSVVSILDSESASLPTPNQPAFVTRTLPLPDVNSSKYELTITDLDGR